MSLLSALTSQPEGILRPYQSKMQSLALFADLSIIFWSLHLSMHFWKVVPSSAYSWCGGLAIALFLVFTETFQVYSLWRGASKLKTAAHILAAWVSTFSLLVVIAFSLDVTALFSRKVIGTWAIAAPTAVISFYIIRRKLLTFLRRHGRNSRSYAVVGATKLGHSLHEKLESMDWLGYKFKGYYDDRQPEDADETRRYFKDDIKITDGLDQLITDAKERKIDLVYITLPLAAEKRIRWLLGMLADTTASVYLVPDFNVFNPVRARWNTIQGIPLVSVYDSPFGEVESFIKRAFDIIVSSLILLLISIPMLMIAVLIKRDSSGPVIFKQKRYGIDGDQIEVWKFRSMKVVENGSVVTQAKKNDTRVTKLGAFLRRTSLDELPQFINVLQGRMSIIGPRPHAVAHNEHYRTKVHGYMMRHKVKPGITGLAQVNGCRGETDTDEKMQARVKYDLEYINHWSLWLDVKIFIKTVFKGFGGKDVY